MSAVRRRRSPRTRGWRRPERTHRSWEPRCHPRALAHSGNARDAGRWRRACRRTDRRGAHVRVSSLSAGFGVVARTIFGKRTKDIDARSPRFTTEGTRKRAWTWSDERHHPVVGAPEHAARRRRRRWVLDLHLRHGTSARTSRHTSVSFVPNASPRISLRPSRLTLTLSSGLLPAALVQDRARRKRRDASQVRTHHAQVPHMSRKVRPPLLMCFHVLRLVSPVPARS